MRRRALAMVIMLTGAAAGCESSSNQPAAAVALEEFPAQFASRYCKRAYDCCLPEERAAASPGTDVATCTAEMTAAASENAALLLSLKGVGYFGDAARRCLEILDGAPCGHIFEPTSGTLSACQDVFAGTQALDTPCEDERQCASGICARGACAVPATCPEGGVVDEANGCVARVGVGETCSLSRQCPAAASCSNGVCTPRGKIGDACVTHEDCLGACGVANTGVGVCRAAFCVGQ